MLKNISKMITIALMLLSLGGQAFAQDSAEEPEQSATESTISEVKQLLDTSFKKDDYFHYILSFMWGNFIFDDHNDGAEVSTLSKVVGFMNVISLIFGMVIVGYVLLGSIINSASTGEVLGKSWSTCWLPIRTALSFGSIIPVKVSAYTLSTVQILVIKLIVIASSCATYLWVKTVDDFFVIPNSQQVLQTSGYPYQTAYDISSMAFCSAANLYVNIPDGSWFNFGDGVSEYKSDTFIKIQYQDGEKVISTTDLKAKIMRSELFSFPDTSSNHGVNLITRISFADGHCGSISFNLPVGMRDPDYEKPTFTSDAAPTGQLSSLKQANAAKLVVLKKTQDSMLRLFERAFYHANFVAGYRGTSADLVAANKEPGRLNQASMDYLIQAHLAESSDKAKQGSYESSEIRNLFKSKMKSGLFYYTEVFVDEYRKNIKEVYDAYSSDKNKVSENSERNRLTQGGWVLAGASYFKMSDYVSIASDSYELISQTNPASPSLTCSVTSTDESMECTQQKYMSAALELLDIYYSTIYRDVDRARELFGSVSEKEFIEELEPRLVAAKSASVSVPISIIKNNNPTEIVNTQEGTLSKTMLSISQNIGSYVGEDVSQMKGGSSSEGYTFGNSNPYQDAIMLGHGLNTVKTIAYALSTANQITIQLAQYAQDGINSNPVTAALGLGPGVTLAVIEGVLESMLPVLMAVIMLSTTLGWTLSFYLPMMPVILWGTLVSAYCLIVIEAVVAAPLAVILAATPEGEGIAGQRMEAAIKMLASVLLRPTLMIIGLFASIYIAKISYIIFMTLFWPQAMTYVGEGIFSTFAIIVIYVSVLHQILSRSIMVMDTLPSGILQWIGGGGQAEFGQQGLQSIETIVEGGSSSLQAQGNSFIREARQRRNRASEKEG